MSDKVYEKVLVSLDMGGNSVENVEIPGVTNSRFNIGGDNGVTLIAENGQLTLLSGDPLNLTDDDLPEASDDPNPSTVSYAGTIGDGETTDYTILHDLDTVNLHVTVREVSSGYRRNPSIRFVVEGTISIRFAVAPLEDNTVIYIST